MDASIGAMVINAAAETAEHQSALVTLRVLKALAERAMRSPGLAITAHDLLAVAAELALQLDARIGERLAASKEAG